MKKFIALLVTLSLVMLFSAQVWAADASEMLRYSSPKYKIEMLYPATWRMAENFMGAVVVMVSNDPEDNFHNNVNVIIADLPPNTTLDQLARSSLNVLQRGTSDFELLERVPCQIAQTPAEKLVFTGTQGVYHLYWTQYYTIINNKAYVITFTSDDDNRLPAGLMQKMADSFQVKGFKGPVTEL